MLPRIPNIFQSEYSSCRKGITYKIWWGFFQANMTAIIQPMDPAILDTLKRYYRKADAWCHVTVNTNYSSWYPLSLRDINYLKKLGG